MAGTALEKVLQLSTAVRPSEPAARTAPSDAFAPALRQAYVAEQPRERQSPAAPPAQSESTAGDEIQVGTSEAPANPAAASSHHQSPDSKPDHAAAQAESGESIEAGAAIDLHHADEDAAQARDQDETDATSAAAALVLQVTGSRTASTGSAEAELDIGNGVSNSRDGQQSSANPAGDAVDSPLSPWTDPFGASPAAADEAASAAVNTRDQLDAAADAIAPATAGKAIATRGKTGDNAASPRASSPHGAAGRRVAAEGGDEPTVANRADNSSGDEATAQVDKSPSRRGERASESSAPVPRAGHTDRVEQRLTGDNSQPAVGGASVAAIAGQETPAAGDRAEPKLDPTSGDKSIAATAGLARGASPLERLASSRNLRTTHERMDGESTPSIDRARFVQRVEGAVRSAQQRDGRVQVRLSPPELGALRIELTMQHGALTARVEAETPAARTALLDNLPALRERLAQQDIRIEKFDVDLNRDFAGGSGGRHASDGPTDQSTPRDAGSRARAPVRQEAERPRPAAAAAAVIGDAVLDVRV